jgi:nicotinamide-nucleotide amidase
VDTNSPWLATQLSILGFRVVGIACCPDDPAALKQALAHAASRADFIVSTGGLGPTDDDHTTACAATWANVPLVLHEESLARIRSIWQSRSLEMPLSNEKQAQLPAGCEVLSNDWGTAPGFVLKHGQTTAIFVPGVPREMKGFWANHLAPMLQDLAHLTPHHRAVLRCVGVSESRLQDKLKAVVLPDSVQIHYKAKLPENQVILDAPASLDAKEFARAANTTAKAIGSSCLGVNSPPLPELLGDWLRERKESLAIAESCTGGRISASMTAVPGASAIFLEGACVYSDEAKIRTCGVSAESLEDHGAVSEDVARQLAQGIRSRADSTYGLGVTGIAGPSGGSPDKPVGTVHLALAGPHGCTHRKLSLTGMRRDRIITLTTGLALDTLRRHLQTLPS